MFWYWFLKIFAGLVGLGLLVLTLPRLLSPAGTEGSATQIEIEWERSPEGMKALLETQADEGSQPRTFKKYQQGLTFDSWVIVPAYLTIFILLALHIQKAEPSLPGFYLYAIIFFALTAAISDWTENHFMRAASLTDITQAMVDAKYYANLIKWSLIAAAILFSSLALWKMGKVWISGMGLVDFALLAVGILAHKILFVEWGFSSMGWLLLLMAFLL